MSGWHVRLRALAVRILDPRTIERVIDPLLTDLQWEYDAAERRGDVWKRRWTLIAGHVVFLKTVVCCEAEGLMIRSSDWPADDVAALKRTLGASLAAIAATTAILELPPLLGSPSSAVIRSDLRAILYLIPQALVVAVPFGVTVGVFYGLRGRSASRRSAVTLLLGTTALSLACLVMLAWTLPWANQEFRQLLFAGVPRKGFNELTLGELGECMASLRQSCGPWDSRLLAYSYHLRWALASATAILSLFALPLSQRLVTRWAAALAALATVFVYYTLLWTGRAGVLQHTLPAVVGAWLPNALFGLAWIVAVAATSRTKSRILRLS